MAEKREEWRAAPLLEELRSMQEVFARLDLKGDGRIDKDEINATLQRLGYKPAKVNIYGTSEVEQMIWEVDNDGTEALEWDDFALMYERCTADVAGDEPRRLFDLCTFLSLDRNDSGTVLFEELMAILLHRFGRQKLDQVFTSDVLFEELTYVEFLAVLQAMSSPLNSKELLSQALYSKRAQTLEAVAKQAKKALKNSGPVSPRRQRALKAEAAARRQAAQNDWVDSREAGVSFKAQANDSETQDMYALIDDKAARMQVGHSAPVGNAHRRPGPLRSPTTPRERAQRVTTPISLSQANAPSPNTPASQISPRSHWSPKATWNSELLQPVFGRDESAAEDTATTTQ
eukprot:CAMPEP_0114558292 /NCGR_PEP_ID=MMETSP0114-20121206/10296_1 /TAXON_ID=31324 /ORGANISM="Goniomonas sp, Strain m" /LENGTH=344 /DNA_ID=CAMNT_0001743657 /DNA_START=38 /DNA_END=1072 /DNA_ORIENTATION=+